MTVAESVLCQSHMNMHCISVVLFISCVIHSTISATVSDSNGQKCNVFPEKDVILDFGKKLSGDLVFPGESSFWLASWVGNYRLWKDTQLVVVAKSVEDVRETLLFCKEHDLRPSIKSSGHDYIGRNGEDNALQLNLYNLNETQIDLADSDSPTGASMWAQTGNSWGKVYKEADTYNKVLVGGSAPTVALGGYFGGGGHSPVSPSLGLGGDSVLAIQMLTVDGDIVNVTSTSVSIEYVNRTVETRADGDLFWALRGGGGVFGVVTSYKLVMHPNPEGGLSRFQVDFPLVHPTYGRIGKQVMEFINSQYIGALADGRWGGYLMTSNYAWPGQPGTGHIYMTMLSFGNSDTANATAEAFKNFHPEWQNFFIWNNYSSFWDYQTGIKDPYGGYYYIFNRFLHEEDFQPNSGLADVIMESVDELPIAISCTFCTLGGQKGKPMEYPMESAAISSDFRSAVASTTCGTGYEEKDKGNADYIINKAKEFANNKYYKHGRGMYYNEPDQYSDDWKTLYWGSSDRYDRLLTVKQKWDPEGVLTCLHCVGSDIIPAPCEGCAMKGTLISLVLAMAVLLSFM